MASSHPSPVKDGRRILGEKPANACLSPAHHRHASVSPLKRPFLETPSSPKKLLRSPLFAGQKRSIDQVDSEAPSSTQPSAPAPSRPDASQDVQDDIQQDSPQTLSQSHATESETLLLDSDKQQQHHQDTHPVSPPPTTTAAAVTTHSDPPANDPAFRKRFIQEKATLLRTRLQTAMRHIHDPQLDRRLSDLEAHSRKYPRLSLPHEQRSTAAQSSSASSSNSKTNPGLTTPRVTQFTSHITPSAPSSALHVSGLSSPPLSTTPVASQADQQPHPEQARKEEEEDEDEDPMKTPTQKSHHRIPSPMQLSSPPATVSRRRSTLTTEEMVRVDEEVEVETEMAGDEEMDSHPEERQRRLSQKGDAVDGLLKLMKTGDQTPKQNQSEGLEVWSG
ncbi:uncharacterized protein BO80DRAFT_424471 [Aspergillus ibericus CBS 121593]|uniref:Uncharacterized protein n=1 Tax=Aspergillus ibericus CBS 121593 TaxID=1448316 RepID=A0A395H183_9EURO|nr:hypothetical protein BO80DRAFT_424471 [Aspergillus ibericus CBS 121593]RAL01641.1 hypothetical protein BO80DRAFT_424471 [Aspergillus ibericus CBS 121593]